MEKPGIGEVGVGLALASLPLAGTSVDIDRNPPNGDMIHVGVEVPGEPVPAIQNLYESANSVPFSAVIAVGVIGCSVAVVYGARQFVGGIFDRVAGKVKH